MEFYAPGDVWPVELSRGRFHDDFVQIGRGNIKMKLLCGVIGYIFLQKVVVRLYIGIHDDAVHARRELSNYRCFGLWFYFFCFQYIVRLDSCV